MRGLLPVLAAALMLGTPGCKQKLAPPPVDGDVETNTDATEPSAEDQENRPPTIQRVHVLPAKPTIADDLSAEAKGFDPDGDFVSFTFQWYVNDRKLLGEISDTLRAGEAVHGDAVVVEAIPNDGNAEGAPSRSSAVRIVNSAPELLNSLEAGMSLDGFQMRVTDPDNDPISYRLEGAPPNMSISADGTLHWRPRPDDKAGDYTVTMLATDGQGGSVTVRFPAKVVPPQP